MEGNGIGVPFRARARLTTSTAQPAAHEEAVSAFWRTCLRWPSQRPQKGRQAVLTTSQEEEKGEKEEWAGTDKAFDLAFAFSPGAFVWERSQRRLVVLAGLWTSVPLQRRDPQELADDVRTRLDELGTASPHFMFEGEGRIWIWWNIRALIRPGNDNDDDNQKRHRAFSVQITAWQRAVMKLSFALEPLGAIPLDVATAADQLTNFVPLPLPSNSDLRRHAPEMHFEPSNMLWKADDISDVVIADISKPMGGAIDARMWATYGVCGRGRKNWMRSAKSLAALEPQGPGHRHPSAVAIACACVWDGWELDATKAKLHTWVATCVDDGRFPKSNELMAIAEWAHSRLRPGGPTTPPKGSAGTHSEPRRTNREDISAAVVGFLRSEGGAFAGATHELAKHVALWRIAHGQPGSCPLRSLKRALGDLSELGLVLHEPGWGTQAPSRWRAIQATAELSGTEGQKVQSARPAPPAGFFYRGGLGGDLPLGRESEGGSTPVQTPKPDASRRRRRKAKQPQDAAPEAETPEISPPKKPPRQRRLAFGDRRKRKVAPKDLPPIDRTVRDALADLGRDLSDADHQALLEEGRSELRDRPRTRADFLGCLRRRVGRILKMRALLEASRAHDQAKAVLKARAPAPPPLALVPWPTALFAEAQTRLHDLDVIVRSRRLCDQGLSLLPLKPASKVPALETWRELQTSRLTPRRLEQHLGELGADAGLAIICGPVSGVVAVDLDAAAAVEWANKHLPPTPWRTKTSRGEHWFYRLPSTWSPPSSPLPWKGELRAAGHYVVAPGSTHPDTGERYQALGAWSTPKGELPEWDVRWLDVPLDVEALRAERAKVLKG